MEEPTFSHHDDQGHLIEQRDSHWLPALRPDAEAIIVDGVNSVGTNLPESIQPEDVQHVDIPASNIQPEKTNFDEDDGRLDPAWGIQRTDSAHLLDAARRSPSFPGPADIEKPLDISEKVADATSEIQDKEDLNQLPNGVGSTTEESSEDTGHIGDPVIASSIPPEELFNAGHSSIENLDSRFEEGLPLLPATQPQTAPDDSVVNQIQNDPFQSDAFEQLVHDDGAPNDEDSFFSQIRNKPENGDIQVQLQRKSTDDVLDALHVAKRERVVDAPGKPSEDAEIEVEGGLALGGDSNREGDVNSKWAAVLDDDEFLVEDADDLLPDSEPGSPSSFIAALRDDSSVPSSSLDHASNQSTLAQPARDAHMGSTSYAPHQPSTSTMTQVPQQSHVGLSRPGFVPMGSFQNHLQQTPPVSRAESFADQAKGGYKSPYDLPMDISKPKKRPQAQRVLSQAQNGLPPPPPLRSSSMSSQKDSQLASPMTATLPQNIAPATGSLPTTARAISATAPPSTIAHRQTTTPSFFEELPVTSKPRAAPHPGRYTPSQSMAAPPSQFPPASPPRQRQPSDQSLPSPPRTADSYSQFQLRPPEKLDPFANTTLQPPSLPALGASTSRYSPAPGAVPGAPRPTASPRYSPAPPSQPPGGSGRYASQPVTSPPSGGQSAPNRYVSQPIQAPAVANAALPFLPRTSSPLAYQGKPPPEQSSLMPPPPLPTASASAQIPNRIRSPPRQSTPPNVPLPSASTPILSPPKATDTAAPPSFTPPRRSLTQSPSRQKPRSALSMSIDNSDNRPNSAYSHVPAPKGFSQLEELAPSRPAGRAKAAAPELDFEQPEGDTQNDPLQRWKGAPIFRFGFGGVIVSSFPKHTPRYKAGQIKPQIKSTAGEVRSRVSKDLSILPEHVVSFPGPLKGKSKKKDILNWMTLRIAKLESNAPVILGAVQTLPDPRKCYEEEVLLWKIVRIIVEHDGVIDNKSEALKAINVILSPEVHAIDESTASQYRADTDLTGIYRPAGTTLRTDVVDPVVVEDLRKHLLKGEREQAVWKAADSRLWSHALLIASTFKDERKLWKQVVREFVRQEVRTAGNNAESLSALYDIFGGNAEESIDQLVPPSARAGLQMVSTVESSGPTKNALEGLDRWKETLTLVLNNRTPEDQRALATLGALLASYGRVQAAHICFLFARNPLTPHLFGGVDDPQASITLLGFDQRARPFCFHQDHDALLLTEIYEFAMSALAPAPISMSLPHLAAYKLQRAIELADHGLKAEAQSYCDALATGITTKGKVSPYYNASLLMEVDDLAKRLKQVPVQSTSWMAKPSVERATSSLLSRLSNFVAGDESDADSKGSADVGPFAKTSGSPNNLSRSESQTDLFGSYPTTTPTMSVTAANSRYAPGGMSSARSSSDLTRGRPSLDSQRSPPTTSHGVESRYAPSSNMNQFGQSPARSVSSHQPYGTSPSRSNYQPTPPQPSYMPDTVVDQSSTPFDGPQSETHMHTASLGSQNSYMPTLPEQNIQQGFNPSSFGGYMASVQPVLTSEPQSGDATIPGHEQQQSYGYGYEPPADTGFVPYQPDPDSDEDNKRQKPKKKSFMDNDGEDDFPRMSASTANHMSGDASTTAAAAAKRKANDEAADAAFRAAAEADAKRAKEQAGQKKASGSWLGGWFSGGKKGDGSLDSPKTAGGPEPKVIKAKLGEDKMKLYYDKELKKWVNPDDPDSMKAKSATPPPPPGRSPAPPAGVPPRAGSALPPVSVSRASTPASIGGVDGTGLGLPVSSGTPPPASSVTSPAPPALAGLTLPSRPGSNASSIDDLIGPASASRKTGKGARGAKKGRYVDVMAQ